MLEFKLNTAQRLLLAEMNAMNDDDRRKAAQLMRWQRGSDYTPPGLRMIMDNVAKLKAK